MLNIISLIVGILLLISPIVAVFVVIIDRDGWETAAYVFAFTVGALIVVLSGAYLISMSLATFVR